MSNKNVTIKDATDEQINWLLNRLSKEVELQRIIRELRRNATPEQQREFLERSVSTETTVADLYHYGVKGMKWKKGAKGSSADSKEKAKRKAASKGRRGLSDSDIDKRIKRLQSEKKLKDLTDADIAPGRTAIAKLLKQAGTKTAATVLSGSLLYAVKVATTQQFNLKDAAGYVAPKPKTK